MIKQIHRLPIAGTVLNKEPLKGEPSDPIRVIPFSELPGFPTMKVDVYTVKRGYSYENIKYNIDEGWVEIELTADKEVHDFLDDITTKDSIASLATSLPLVKKF